MRPSFQRENSAGRATYGVSRSSHPGGMSERRALGPPSRGDVVVHTEVRFARDSPLEGAGFEFGNSPSAGKTGSFGQGCRSLSAVPTKNL
jgi:hypothetical protein